MQKFIRIAASAIVSSLAIQAHAQIFESTEMRAPSPELMSEARRAGFQGDELTELADTSVAASEIATRAAIHIPRSRIIEVKPQLLWMPTAAPLDPSVPTVTTLVPRQLSTLTLTVDGNKLVLRVVDAERDNRVHGIRHISAVILNKPEGYAAFSVRQKQVAGTIFLKDRTYRILPAADAQILYELQDAGRAVSDGSVREINFLDRESEALLKRHEQYALVTQIAPDYVRTADSGNTRLRGGELGSLPRRKLTSEDLKSWLQPLQPLVKLPPDSSFSVVRDTLRQERSSEDRVVRFRQVFNDIEVDLLNEVVIAQDGRVKELLVTVLDPKVVPKGRPISMDRALMQAQLAFENRIGRRLDSIELLSPARLEYRFEPPASHLSLIYTFALRSGSDSAVVRVNAITEKTSVSLGGIPVGAEYRQHVFEATTGTSPNSGDDTGANEAWYELPNGTITCHSSYCSNSDLLTLALTANNINRYLESATGSTDPTLCCENLGGTDGRVDYVVNTTAAKDSNNNPVAVYHSGGESILFPPIGTGPGDPRNIDTIVHETIHHYHHMYNPSTFGTAQMERVMQEGLADAATGIYAEMYKDEMLYVPEVGELWFIGDGSYPVAGGHRDIATPLQLSHVSTTLSSNPDDVHEASRAIGNFFYRLHAAGIISNARQMELTLKVISILTPQDPTVGLQLFDFYAALQDATRPAETALRAKIAEIWTTMGGSAGGGGTGGGTPPGGGPGQPPPSSPPQAPIFVNGYLQPQACQHGFSSYEVYWASAPSATHYPSYFREPNGLVYRQDFIFSDTDGYAWTNYNTDFRIAACNSVGCSGLSFDSHPMPHICQ